MCGIVRRPKRTCGVHDPDEDPELLTQDGFRLEPLPPVPKPRSRRLTLTDASSVAKSLSVQKQCKLLNLPQELRIIIYTYVLGNREILISIQKYQKKKIFTHKVQTTEHVEGLASPRHTDTAWREVRRTQGFWSRWGNRTWVRAVPILLTCRAM